MTWVKICGITNLEDALTAVDAGADALGFVFYEKSPRYVAAETVSKIVRETPPQIEKVGVFVNQPEDEISAVVDRTRLTAVQLYRSDCAEAFAARCMGSSASARIKPKVIFVASGDQFAEAGGVHLKDSFWEIQKGLLDNLFAVLVDCKSDAQPGGSGRPFDWTKARGTTRALNAICPTVVAGGLSATNVATAMTLLAPWGVDVSSGVESSPGKKDPEKVRAFIAAVRAAEKKI
jgi:phosphoribosylanthranilate isomerase